VFTGREASGQIDEELGCRIDAGHQQIVAGSGAGDIEQVALGVVDLFEVRLVDSTEAAPAALPALLARFNSRSLRVRPPISSGGTANLSRAGIPSYCCRRSNACVGFLPAMQQTKQPFWVRLQLLARLTLNPGKQEARRTRRLRPFA
jgi:hypothetical protein